MCWFKQICHKKLVLITILKKYEFFSIQAHPARGTEGA